jgi:hypothetical protein
LSSFSVSLQNQDDNVLNLQDGQGGLPFVLRKSTSFRSIFTREIHHLKTFEEQRAFYEKTTQVKKAEKKNKWLVVSRPKMSRYSERGEE